MKPVTRFTSRTVALPTKDIDTDQIIAARFLTTTSREGLGKHAFHDLRYLDDGSANPDFPLNRPEAEGCSILVAGNNFGCGSSREHAVWALYDYGIRAVIAESFGRIFHRNCARNGLLAIELPAEQIDVLADSTMTAPQSSRVLIDLIKCEIHSPRGEIFKFAIPESDRHMLLNGLDYIEFTMQYENAIDGFVADDRNARGWAYL